MKETGMYSAKAWADSYITDVVMPQRPGQVQIDETHRAFMAGMFGMMQIMKRLGDDDINENKATLTKTCRPLALETWRSGRCQAAAISAATCWLASPSWDLLH